MKTYFACESVLVDDTGGVYHKEHSTVGMGLFALRYTASGAGEGVVVVDKLHETAINYIVANLALAAMHNRPYVMVVSEDEDGIPLEVPEVQIGKPHEQHTTE